MTVATAARDSIRYPILAGTLRWWWSTTPAGPRLRRQFRRAPARALFPVEDPRADRFRHWPTGPAEYYRGSQAVSASGCPSGHRDNSLPVWGVVGSFVASWSALLRLMDFIAKSYRQPLRAQDLAHAVGYSVHHLGHIAHERLGVALMEYLTRFSTRSRSTPPDRHGPDDRSDRWRGRILECLTPLARVPAHAGFGRRLRRRVRTGGMVATSDDAPPEH